MNELMYFVLVVVIFAVQYFLSTRNSIFWGGGVDSSLLYWCNVMVLF
ncbi:hypothetical protein BSAF29S_00990 [Bacillus safensis subsp. safensis]